MIAASSFLLAEIRLDVFWVPDLQEKLAAGFGRCRWFVLKSPECDLACAAQHEPRLFRKLRRKNHDMPGDEWFLDCKDVFRTERSGTVMAQAYCIPAHPAPETLEAFHGIPPIATQFRA